MSATATSVRLETNDIIRTAMQLADTQMVNDLFDLSISHSFPSGPRSTIQMRAAESDKLDDLMFELSLSDDSVRIHIWRSWPAGADAHTYAYWPITDDDIPAEVPASIGAFFQRLLGD